MTDGGWWYYDAFSFFFSAFLWAVLCWMNADQILPACRACGRTVLPRSLFTLVGADTLIPNGLSDHPSHELHCSENTLLCLEQGLILSAGPFSGPAHLLLYLSYILLVESGLLIKLPVCWANIKSHCLDWLQAIIMSLFTILRKSNYFEDALNKLRITADKWAHFH